MEYVHINISILDIFNAIWARVTLQINLFIIHKTITSFLKTCVEKPVLVRLPKLGNIVPIPSLYGWTLDNDKCSKLECVWFSWILANNEKLEKWQRVQLVFGTLVYALKVTNQYILARSYMLNIRKDCHIHTDEHAWGQCGRRMAQGVFIHVAMFQQFWHQLFLLSHWI